MARGGWGKDGGGWTAPSLDGGALVRVFLSPRRWHKTGQEPGHTEISLLFAVVMGLVQSPKLMDMHFAIILPMHNHPKLHSLIGQLHLMVIQ